MTPNRWLVLAALFLARTSLGYHYQSVASVSPLLVDELGLNFSEIGALIGFFSLLGMAAALPAGFLGRRFGEPRAVLIGLGAMALGGFIMGFGATYEAAVAGRLLAGAGAVFLTVSMTKMVTDWFAGREIVTALAILMNSWPVGIALGLVTQGAIAETWGWQAAFLAAALFSLTGVGLVLLIARIRPDGPDAAPGGVSGGAGAGMWRWTISRREMLLISLAGGIWTLYNGGFIVIFGFAPTLLVERGYDVVDAGALISVGTWVYMVAIPLGGWLSERWRRPTTVMAGCFVIGAACVAATPFVEPIVIAFALVGLFIGVPTGNVMALNVETVRAENRNIGIGIYYTWHYLGMSVTPAFAGWMLDMTHNTAVPMYVGTGSMILATLALVVLRRLQAAHG